MAPVPAQEYVGAVAGDHQGPAVALGPPVSRRVPKVPRSTQHPCPLHAPLAGSAMLPARAVALVQPGLGSS